MPAPWGRPKKRQLLKALPKTPPSTLAPFGVWEVTRGGSEELLNGVVVVVEVYHLAGDNASKSYCEQLRKGGVAVTLHTGSPQCNQKNCLYIAVRVLLWPTTSAVGVARATPPLKNVAMLRRECRAMFDMVTAWVQTPRNLSLRRTGWAPSVVKDITKVAGELPGCVGKGPVPFAPLTGNNVPAVMLHQITTSKQAECESESDPGVSVSSTGVKGKRKGAPPSPVPEP